MGMYTEVFITCRLENISKEILPILEYMFDLSKRDVPAKLPKHEFFTKPRWDMIGKCSSFYFIPEPMSRFWKDETSNAYFLISRSDIKNYDGEIEAFFDWIMPYVDEPTGQFIGYSRYEESDLPEIVVKK